MESVLKLVKEIGALGALALLALAYIAASLTVAWKTLGRENTR